VGPEPKNIPKTKYAKMYITKNQSSKIRLDLVSITSRIGIVDAPCVVSATVLSAGGLSAGVVPAAVLSAGGLSAGFVPAAVLSAGGLSTVGLLTGSLSLVAPTGGLLDADISFYIILRYFFR
jgi:hypothetical protein